MISYINQDISFNLPGKRLNNLWLKEVVKHEGKVLGSVSIVFCSDEYILKTNRQYLGHDYYTDIITFDYCEGNLISGDLIISVDSVRSNSQEFNSGFDNELDRVMVHGVLHLIGYDDHTPEDVAVMRAKEDKYIAVKRELQGNV